MLCALDAQPNWTVYIVYGTTRPMNPVSIRRPGRELQPVTLEGLQAIAARWFRDASIHETAGVS